MERGGRHEQRRRGGMNYFDQFAELELLSAGEVVKVARLGEAMEEGEDGRQRYRPFDSLRVEASTCD